jgi:hypothetical protein
MTLLGVFGILLGLTSFKWAIIDSTRLRVAVFVFAYLLHVAMSLLYFNLAGTSADSWLYYADPLGYYLDGFGLSTQFVVYTTQAVKLTIGGTYLDYFLVFQAIGFFGIALLMRSFEEIFRSVEQPQSFYLMLLLFIPGLHYWSSAVGKDSLFFFAVVLSLWAALNIKGRLFWMGFAMLLMLLIRPHIALVALAALAVTVIGDRGTTVPARILLAFGALAGTAFSVASVWSAFQIDLTNADTVSDALAGGGRETLAEGDAGGNTSVNVGYPFRILSLLFRPFFVDANGALGLVVSFENLILIPIVFQLILHWKTLWKLARNVPFVRYAIVSSVVTLLVLSIGYYNVGLGIRQKATMILPGLLIAFVALRAVLALRASPATQLVMAQAPSPVPRGEVAPQSLPSR